MLAQTSTGQCSPFTAAMFEILTKAFVYALEAYAGLGFVVAVPFVWFGVQRLDSEAQGSGVGFRLQIRRGYGNGLKSYRRLVYAHIAPSKLQTKLHNYFSPEEIAAIQMKVQEHPDLLAYWREHVLANLQEIRSGRRQRTCAVYGLAPVRIPVCLDTAVRTAVAALACAAGTCGSGIGRSPQTSSTNARSISATLQPCAMHP